MHAAVRAPLAPLPKCLRRPASALYCAPSAILQLAWPHLAQPTARELRESGGGGDLAPNLRAAPQAWQPPAPLSRAAVPGGPPPGGQWARPPHRLGSDEQLDQVLAVHPA
jgi:hypothetical protein